jgi:hypothetical protein
MLVDIEFIEEMLEQDECPVYPEFRLALVGFSVSGTTRAIYDYDKCVTILVNEQGMDESEACQHMDFNVVGNYIGDNTPIIMSTQYVQPEKGIGVLINERRQVRYISDGNGEWKAPDSDISADGKG